MFPMCSRELGNTRGKSAVVAAHAACKEMCPEPDSNRHAPEEAARFKLAVSAFHHPGVDARLRVWHMTLSGGVPRTAEHALDVVLFY